MADTVAGFVVAVHIVVVDVGWRRRVVAAQSKQEVFV